MQNAPAIIADGNTSTAPQAGRASQPAGHFRPFAGQIIRLIARYADADPIGHPAQA
jgi:hypothetical protein